MLIIHDENAQTVALYQTDIEEVILEVNYLIERDAQVIVDFFLLYVQIAFFL